MSERAIVVAQSDSSAWYDALAQDASATLSVCQPADIDFFAGCRKAHKQSREAQAYVAYIVQHWDALPARIAFIHGHNTSWHHHHTCDWHARLLAALSSEAEHYIHLGDIPVCTGLFHQTDWCDDAWPAVFEPYLGAQRRACPHNLCTFKGAEFVVSRTAVRRQPLAFWRALHDLLTGHGRIGDRTLNSSHNNPDRAHAYLFEWVHHLIFGAEPQLAAALRLSMGQPTASTRERALEPRQLFGDHLRSESARLRDELRSLHVGLDDPLLRDPVAQTLSAAVDKAKQMHGSLHAALSMGKPDAPKLSSSSSSSAFSVLLPVLSLATIGFVWFQMRATTRRRREQGRRKVLSAG